MTWDELEEIRGIVERICAEVLSTAPATPALEQVVGRMLADDNMAHIATYSTALAVALDIARQAGGTQPAIARVRLAALKETPRWPGGTATALASIRLSLATEARIVSVMTFRSREDASIVLKTMNTAFGDAALVAADGLDAATYSALISLQSMVVKALTDQALKLPFIVDYREAVPRPSLRMSQNVYGNGARSQELIDENKVVHPAFMPLEGRMLST